MNSNQIRKIIVEQSKRAHVGHIGSCLSIADIVSVLFDDVLNVPAPDNPERDRFILSKGHAALAIYAALHLKGLLDAEQLNTFHEDNSLLGVHPEHQLDGIDFSTGSLGQGLSIGIGAALAARIQRSQRRVFVLLSDAELNEGATWEAVMFAGHHKLQNLTAIVDLNGQQALDYTDQVIDINPVEEKWRMFGWDARTVDGHDVAELRASLLSSGENSVQPRAIIARTTFGKGVSYMENKIKWHYWPMSDEEYAQALVELGY